MRTVCLGGSSALSDVHSDLTVDLLVLSGPRCVTSMLFIAVTASSFGSAQLLLQPCARSVFGCELCGCISVRTAIAYLALFSDQPLIPYCYLPLLTVHHVYSNLRRHC